MKIIKHLTLFVLFIILSFAIYKYQGTGIIEGFIDNQIYLYEKNKYEVKFDKKQWKDKSLEVNKVWTTRIRMCQDLINSDILIGKTEKEVVDILGKEDYKYILGKEDHKSSDSSICYVLGADRQLYLIKRSGDLLTKRSDDLLIIFMKNGQVAAVDWMSEF
jgi:hypothetical protein